MPAPDLAMFPPSFLKPEALTDVLEWVASWPLPIESKKSALKLWADTYGVTLTRANWLTAIPEEVQEPGANG